MKKSKTQGNKNYYNVNKQKKSYGKYKIRHAHAPARRKMSFPLAPIPFTTALTNRTFFITVMRWENIHIVKKK